MDGWGERRRVGVGEVIRVQPKGQDMISDGWPASQCAACKKRDL